VEFNPEVSPNILGTPAY